MTTPASNLRARWGAPAAGALFALLAIASFGGCFVSFDGYQLGDAGGDGAHGGNTFAGHAGASGAEAMNGGAAIGGANSSAGADGESGGASSAGKNGVAGAPNGGSSNAAGAAALGGNANGGSANGGSAGATTAGAGGSAGAPAVHCPEPHNRISVEIPDGNGSFYCIDRGEVKNVEYKAFLDSNPALGGQPTACAFNSDYQPDTTTTGCNQYDPVGLKNEPIACVDWCDAAAFCKWDGKHLCGKIGGGSVAAASFADASKSAWYRACSHAGDQDFPYPGVYQGKMCVGADNTAVHPVAVPDTDCVGGYDGLYDMSGNVAEWEDSCTADSGASDQCLDRGGSYLDTDKSVASSPSLQCNSNVHGQPKSASKPRSTRDKEIGFRCCAEPVSGPL